MEDSHKLMALPHPERVRFAYEAEGMGAGASGVLFGSDWPKLKALLQDTTLTIADVAETMAKDSSTFGNRALAFARMTNGTGLGDLDGMLHTERLFLCDWKRFQTRDSLEQRLIQTDLGDDLPCLFFRLPYPMMYIEFGETRSSPYVLHNDVSGAHVLEGVYCHETKTLVNGESRRQIHMMFTGSPMGKTGGLLDDATLSIRFIIPDENTSLTRIVSLACDDAAESSRTQNLKEPSPQEREDLKQAVLHTAKVLLYLNSEEARTQDFPELSTLKQAWSRLGKSKQAKMARKMRKAYDRILVGPESYSSPGLQGGLSGSQSAGVSAHWRRGHFRHQAYGEARSLRKLIWIQPTLVAFQEGLVAQSKPYKLGRTNG